MRTIEIGAAARFEIVPDLSHTAAAIGNTGVAAVSTPSLIALLEQASHLAICAAFDPGEGSVGTQIAIDHVAAAVPGRRLTASARVVAVEKRRIRFAVEAEQDGRTIIRGHHERVVVELERFAAGLARETAAAAPQRTITFWFDFHSPWCCLASARIAPLAARHGAALVWRPLHLARLIEAIKGRRALEENASFLRWYKQDLQDWAALYGMTIRYHPSFPLRPSRALRIALLAAEQGKAQAWVGRVMRAYWSESADIADIAVLARLGAETGLDRDAVIDAAESAAYRAVLERNTAEAIDGGIFGVPSFVVDGKIFFGNDRLMLLDRYLGGDALDRFASGLA